MECPSLFWAGSRIPAQPAKSAEQRTEGNKGLLEPKTEIDTPGFPMVRHRRGFIGERGFPYPIGAIPEVTLNGIILFLITDKFGIRVIFYGTLRNDDYESLK